MAWEELIQKPRGNILTEFLRITVSRMTDVRHAPQCINQMKEPMKTSLSLEVTHIFRNGHIVAYWYNMQMMGRYIQ